MGEARRGTAVHARAALVQVIFHTAVILMTEPIFGTPEKVAHLWGGVLPFVAQVR